MVVGGGGGWGGGGVGGQPLRQLCQLQRVARAA